ncbi:uncharacterized protein LY79DRAFT_576632 [Colletotrichum navitas]|uniref:Myb-like domain-containing protein n=1 Tax=Colletotrichum navitas TaxID=681940 RepID=A0AAD8Q8N4_9PEZI|nr:uncharacterized protein LY79DRAFT_576632 [Colletotrichum navitas]KAK1597326.1 hypothetical protein LY79DRAFT_576632 [Colletotrichum navitas]
MADSTSTNAAEGAPAGGRPGGWTDTERFQLVLRVLATILTEGRGVDWKGVNMPNRTLKAMQGQWTSILAQMRDLNTEDGGDAPASKAKTREPSLPSPLHRPSLLTNSFEARKKSAAKKKAAAAKNSENANEDSGDDQDDGKTKKTVAPKKRAAATDADGTPKKRRAAAKKTATKTEPVSDEAGTEADVPKEENSDEK